MNFNFFHINVVLDHVNSILLECIVVPLNLYSDHTMLSKSRRTIGHPIILNIGNIACENWYLYKGHILIAMLLVLQTGAISSL